MEKAGKAIVVGNHGIRYIIPRKRVPEFVIDYDEFTFHGNTVDFLNKWDKFRITSDNVVFSIKDLLIYDVTEEMKEDE